MKNYYSDEEREAIKYLMELLLTVDVFVEALGMTPSSAYSLCDKVKEEFEESDD